MRLLSNYINNKRAYMGPHKRVPRSAPRAAWGVISARVEGRGQRRGGSPFRPSRSPASSRAWPTRQGEGVENYSANITCTYIPRRVLVCTSLGGADDLELPSFPFRPTNHRCSLPFSFLLLPWRESFSRGRGYWDSSWDLRRFFLFWPEMECD